MSARARGLVARGVRSPEVWIWLGVWILTRAFILARVGYWTGSPEIEYADVNQYQAWSDQIASTGALPTDEAWQYPPGAGFLMLLPRIGGGEFGESFVIMMLAFDLLGLILLGIVAKERGSSTGVWLWLLGIPLLGTLSVLRFDLVPTVIAIAGLVVIHRRPAWFGALAGLGASLKVWPIVILFGEWDPRRLLRSMAAAGAAIVAVLVVSQICFGNPFGFLGQQGGRGLQVEAVAAAPWQLREVVVGTPVPEAIRYGAWEIPSAAADAVATLLDLAALLIFLAASIWWWGRKRAINSGRTWLASVVLAQDFVFAIVLWLVVASRVLSPQYLIWLLGLVALTLSARDSRLRRPGWFVVAALILTPSAYGSPASTLIRNLALVIAAVDAALILASLLRKDGVEPQRLGADANGPPRVDPQLPGTSIGVGGNPQGDPRAARG